MYNLYKLDEDLYQIHSSFTGEKAMEGTLLGILTYATHTLKFSPDELEYALLDMLKNDNDVGHFGINRSFIYSYKKKDRKAG